MKYKKQFFVRCGGGPYRTPLKSRTFFHASMKNDLDFKDVLNSYKISSKSHIEQIVESAFDAAEKLGKSFLLLDRFFLSRSALILLDKLNQHHYPSQESNLVEIITKAKINVVAYQKPEKGSEAKPGRPRIRGDAVKLGELFSNAALFRKAKALLYGKEEEISYYSVDLLWKQGLYKELRFVLIEYGTFRSIFVSTDLTLDPIRIAELYTSRFSIEELFREFKQQLGGFCYRFWTACLPKLDHFAKKGTPSPLELISTHFRSGEGTENHPCNRDLCPLCFYSYGAAADPCFG